MIRPAWFAIAAVLFLCLCACTRRPQSTDQGAAVGADSGATRHESPGLSAGAGLTASTRYEVVPAGSPDRSGKLEVTVLYTSDEIPEQSEVPVNINVEYCSHKVLTENLIVDRATRGLKNVVLRLEGLTRGSRQPTEKITVLNQGCSFVPHVSVAVKGALLEIRNEDPVFHTTHPYVNGRHFFNISLQKKGEPGDASRPRPLKTTGVVEFNCDVHKWMRGYTIVHTNPYLAVSDAQGKIVLDEIPPGEYPYVAWHEQLGEKRGRVKIEPTSVAPLKLEFELRQ